MYFIIQQLLSLIKLLHSDNSDEKIAWAFVLGFFSAIAPLSSLQGVLIVLIALVFRFQFGAFLLSWLFFSIVLMPFMGLFHSFGAKILEVEGLREVYTAMQMSDLLSLTRFNNTIVMGGFWAALILSPLVYLASKFLLKKYRLVFFKYIKSTKVYYFLKSTIFVKVYDLYGKYGQV